MGFLLPTLAAPGGEGLLHAGRHQPVDPLPHGVQLLGRARGDVQVGSLADEVDHQDRILASAQIYRLQQDCPRFPFIYACLHG